MDPTETNPARGATAADAPVRRIQLLYQLFLGRPPENQNCIDDNLEQTVDALALGFIRSAEFAARMARVEAEPEAGQDDVDLDAALQLATRHFGVDLHANESVTMPTVLGATLESDNLWPEFHHLFGERAGRIAGLLRRTALRVPPSDWLGYVDQADEQQIRCWILRRSDPAPVRVGILIDGRLIARVEASGYRADVVELLGMRGNCGVRIRNTLPAEHCRNGAIVSLIHLASGDILPVSGRMQLTSRPPSSTEGDLLSASQTADHPPPLPAFALREGLHANDGITPYPVAKYDRFRFGASLPAPNTPSDTNCHFCLILPLLPGKTGGALATLNSLLRQSWSAWTLLVVNGLPTGSDKVGLLREIARSEPRVTVLETVGVRTASDAHNVGIRSRRGSHLIFLDPGIELESHALAWFGYAFRNSSARLIYSDHCQTRAMGGDEQCLTDPVLKPAFDPGLLLQTDYIGPAFCMEANLATAAAKADLATLSDLVYGAHERLAPGGILHLPMPLFLLPFPQPTPFLAASRQATTSHLVRTGKRAIADHAEPTRLTLSEDWLRWPSPESGRKLSIIIATRDRVDLLVPCIDSIRRTMASPAETEIVIVDNGSTDPVTLSYLRRAERDPGIRIVTIDDDFNWSRLNNIAAASCDSDLLLFLNNDTEIQTRGFDEILRQHLARPGIGALGCLLLYPDGTVQHAGTAIGTGGVAAHIGVGDLPEAVAGTFNRLTRRVGAVTGAFLAMRRETFDVVGGFDEKSLKITLNDVDFCLNVAKRGLAVIYTPTIVCLHHENASRGDDTTDMAKEARAEVERAAFRQRWGAVLRFDPFHNPCFSRMRDPFTHVVMPTSKGIEDYLRCQEAWPRQDESLEP